MCRYQCAVETWKVNAEHRPDFTAVYSSLCLAVRVFFSNAPTARSGRSTMCVHVCLGDIKTHMHTTRTNAPDHYAHMTSLHSRPGPPPTFCFAQKSALSAGTSSVLNQCGPATGSAASTSKVDEDSSSATGASHETYLSVGSHSPAASVEDGGYVSVVDRSRRPQQQPGKKTAAAFVANAAFSASLSTPTLTIRPTGSHTGSHRGANSLNDVGCESDDGETHL